MNVKFDTGIQIIINQIYLSLKLDIFHFLQFLKLDIGDSDGILDAYPYGPFFDFMGFGIFLRNIELAPACRES